jgi:hypothetical protein
MLEFVEDGVQEPGVLEYEFETVIVTGYSSSPA